MLASPTRLGPGKLTGLRERKDRHTDTGTKKLGGADLGRSDGDGVAQSLSLFIMDSIGGKVSSLGGRSLQGSSLRQYTHSHRHQREICQFPWVWGPGVLAEGAKGQSHGCFFKLLYCYCIGWV